jgi:nucleoside-diphosphate-sugar epimerase
MKILVTGGSGRIGTYVMEVLEKSGYEAINYDIIPPKTSEQNFIKGDVRDRTALKKAIRGIDVVVHLAAYPNERSIPNYWDGWDLNVGGTFNVLQASVENGVKKFIYASSICVNGPLTWARIPALQYFPIDEKHPFRAQDLYGMGKVIGENLCYMYGAKFCLSVICLRFATVWFGHEIGFPDEEVIEAIKAPEKVFEKPRVNNLKRWRDIVWQYVGVKDVAESIKLAIEKEVSGYDAYNIGAAETPTDWPSLKLAEFFYQGTPIRNPELFLANPKRPLFDISKAQRELGYRPKTNWKEFL